MLVALIIVSVLFLLQSIYLLYYKHQIRDINSQLTFITKHDSFKFVHIQMKSKEIYQLVQISNQLLKNKRNLNQQYIKKNEEVTATMVSLSHDIRTPLTSLGGYLHLADNTENLAEKSQYITLAQNRMKHIVTLVDELFFYTKLQNPEYNLELYTVDGNDVLQKQLFSVIDEFSQRDKEPDLQLPESPVYMEGNINALERVLENIFSNYFLHGEGALSIRYEEKQNEVNVHFENMLGTDQNVEVDKIFDRFYKGDASRTLQSSGLGLFIVQSLMQKMNGSADVNIKDEKFCLSLTFKKEDNHG